MLRCFIELLHLIIKECKIIQTHLFLRYNAETYLFNRIKVSSWNSFLNFPKTIFQARLATKAEEVFLLSMNKSPADSDIGATEISWHFEDFFAEVSKRSHRDLQVPDC